MFLRFALSCIRERILWHTIKERFQASEEPGKDPEAFYSTAERWCESYILIGLYPVGSDMLDYEALKAWYRPDLFGHRGHSIHIQQNAGDKYSHKKEGKCRYNEVPK